MRSFVIGKNDSGQRLDKFLEKAVPLLPKSLMYKYIRLKRIKLDGGRTEFNTILKEDSLLELYINDEFFSHNRDLYFLSAPDKLSIVYEDENILITNKEAGLIVHEDSDESVDTLINRIKRYLYNKKEYDPEKENSFAPALCNRIDRNTEGLVIAAKNAQSLKILNDKIKQREIDKRYLCIVFGKFNKKEDTLKAFLTKNSDKNIVNISAKGGEKTILTKYKVLKEAGNLSLLEIELLTGRTHQIRAHMAHMGHPLLGDSKYGIGRDSKKYGMRYQALCSYKLTFSFKTDAGILEYLKGKSFEVPSVSFAENFEKIALS
ncbi:MAG: RluA family pseudouridine synthase [Oscillospiraceae bacterium]|nr:RluA family pseudouridine synthase [Oscillospiraceae bacterium]